MSFIRRVTRMFEKLDNVGACSTHPSISAWAVCVVRWDGQRIVSEDTSLALLDCPAGPAREYRFRQSSV
jgi:hypothetical protein